MVGLSFTDFANSALAAGRSVALSLTARAVGSPVRAVWCRRGRLASFAHRGDRLRVHRRRCDTRRTPAGLVLGSALLIAQLGVDFFILQSAFRLNVGRDVSPFGVILPWGSRNWPCCFHYQTVRRRGVRASDQEHVADPQPRRSVPGEQATRFIPNNWDLVTYWSQDTHPAIYCKRLIGLPGETLRFDQGGIFVNGTTRVALPSVLAGRCHASPAAIPANEAQVSRRPVHFAGRDEYFLIGDNVDISADSRLAGPSASSSLVGVVEFLYWPLSRARLMR